MTSSVYTTHSLTNNGDGTLTLYLNGIMSFEGNKLRDLAPHLLIGEKYTLNANTTGSAKYIYLDGASITWKFGNSLTITEDILDSKVCWYTDGDKGVNTVTISDIVISAVIDFSSKQVKVCGKNLFDGKLILGAYSTATGQHVLEANRYCCDDFVEIASNGKYFIASNLSKYSDFWILYYDENKNYLKVYNHFETIPTNAKYIKFYNVRSGNSLDELVQIECGKSATPYEPPIEPIYYTPNADGTVDGVTSISPNMNIICNGVDISAKYYFIAERDRKPDYCTKVDYQFNNLNVFGKKEIAITNDKMNTGTSMFQQTVLNTTVEHITVNSTSSTVGLYQMFCCAGGYDLTLKHITLNFDVNGGNATQAFYALRALEVIDGKPINLVKTNASHYISLMFGYCDSLKEVRFVPNSIVYSINFASSPLLSNDTINSIIDGLADMTGKTAMVLTLHADVKAKLTEEQIASITAKNWTLA